MLALGRYVDLASKMIQSQVRLRPLRRPSGRILIKLNTHTQESKSVNHTTTSHQRQTQLPSVSAVHCLYQPWSVSGVRIYVVGDLPS